MEAWSENGRLNVLRGGDAGTVRMDRFLGLFSLILSGWPVRARGLFSVVKRPKTLDGGPPLGHPDSTFRGTTPRRVVPSMHPSKVMVADGPGLRDRRTPYGPRLAIQWLQKEPGVSFRRVEGTLAFVDISALTKMCERR